MTSTSPNSTRQADNGATAVTIIDVLSGQRAVLAAAGDPARQPDLLREHVIEPLRPVWEPMFANPWMQDKRRQLPSPDDPAGIADMLQLYPLDGDPDAGLALLDRFAAADSLAACGAAVVRALDVLAPSAHGIEITPVEYTLALASPDASGLGDRNWGYTGFGGMGGVIMMLALPDGRNLPRLPAMAAHETHHKVRLAFEPWNPATITVGQYYVLEGLAEAFAAELYGEESLGPWVTFVAPDELAKHKPALCEALEKTGDPRPYLFGDWASGFGGYEPLGLPDFIGYTAGYQLVRSYLRASGQSAAEASWLPWREIVAGSDWA
jgi:uncharacterized protein YjaZ